MARGLLPKAYLRIDPNLDQHPESDGMLLLICAAARQAHRGRFSRFAVDRILGRKRAERFISPRMAGKSPDLTTLEDGSLYLAGWDEWNEGDLTVGERMRRIREQKSYSRNKAVTEPFPKRNPPSEASRQQGSKAGTESTAPPRKLSRISTAKYERLVAQPELRALGEFWVEHLGGTLNLGLLDACQAFFAGRYPVDIAHLAIKGLVMARDQPDRMDPRGSARWAHKHNPNPGWVLRPGNVEKHAAEYQAAMPTSPKPEPPPQPRPLRERDDRPATTEEMERIRADRAAAFEAAEK